MEATETKGIDLLNYPYPKLSGVDMVFSTVKTDNKLLAEAKRLGFYQGYKPENKRFSQLFFDGGKLNINKEITIVKLAPIVTYFKCLAQSFEPKHEEKEAVCAMLLSVIEKS